MIQNLAIIGAGPYGLSIAAHLQERGISFRIFGRPMHTWQNRMPAGMSLKSEGFASSLFDPSGSFTLAHYCTANGIPYQDVGLPVRLETFWRYGIEFQQRFLPELDEREVTRLESRLGKFRLVLDDGSEVEAKHVVVATGLSHFANLPPELASVPEPFVTHSSQHRNFDGFAGKDVVVLGAGASAVDCASLLHQAGASVRLVSRQETIRFHAPPRPRSLLDRIRAPMSGLGPGWRSRLCTDMPLMFHFMPERFRLRVVRRHLGPAPCWWTKDEVVGKIPIHRGTALRGAGLRGERVTLWLIDRTGDPLTLSADRVIAATGFQVDLRRLAFLDPALLARIRVAEQTPVLSARFESSVPGLYFVGISSANSFGPMMRFAYGAGYTARRLAAHFSRLRRPALNPASVAGRRPTLSESDA